MLDLSRVAGLDGRGRLVGIYQDERRRLTCSECSSRCVMGGESSHDWMEGGQSLSLPFSKQAETFRSPEPPVESKFLG